MNKDHPPIPISDDWYKMDKWRLDDAISLLLNVDPRQCGLKRESDDKFNATFKLALKVARSAENDSLEVITETKVADLRVDLAIVEPRKFIKWARSKGYEIPDKLTYLLQQEKNTSLNGGALERLRNIEYWKSLEGKAVKAINEYPKWSERLNREPKMSDLDDWLNVKSMSDNIREADVLRKVLTEAYKLKN